MAFLDQPLTRGKLKLKNRLVLPPMYSGNAEPDGTVSQNVLDFYDGKTRGGYLGLVIIEHSYVALQGKARERQIAVCDDSDIPGLARLAETIHRNGTKAVVQINHGGSSATEQITGMMPVAPSAIPTLNRNFKTLPGVLDRAGIEQIIRDFAAAAVRVQKAGFDGVEIHGAHGYLLSQFISPITNVRTDEYGGDIAGRNRIQVEITRAVRDAVGPDFPVLFRQSITDYMDGGLTFDEGKIACRAVVDAGVDLLDVSGGMCAFVNIPNPDEPGFFSHMAKEIRALVDVPVLVAGGVKTAADAELILREERADLVGVGRAMLKDPLWAKKAMESLT
jgi:2,4-dienoyl-CoA reductase-like NADH-dependent reductase (Old Yellow Enzyme family)